MRALFRGGYLLLRRALSCLRARATAPFERRFCGLGLWYRLSDISSMYPICGSKMELGWMKKRLIAAALVAGATPEFAAEGPVYAYCSAKDRNAQTYIKIGRASCRESVCQYV